MGNCCTNFPVQEDASSAPSSPTSPFHTSEMAEPSDVLVSQQEGYVVKDDLIVEQEKARKAKRDEIQRRKDAAAYEKDKVENKKRAEEAISTHKFGESLRASRTSEMVKSSDKGGKSAAMGLSQQQGYVVKDDLEVEKEKASKAQRDEIQRQKQRAEYEKDKEEENKRVEDAMRAHATASA